MFNWLKRKILTSQEYETLNTRFRTLQEALYDAESRIRRLELEQDDFRDKVLRKIQTRRSYQEAETLQESPPKLKKIFGGGVRHRDI